jgi:hypothetical protein
VFCGYASWKQRAEIAIVIHEIKQRREIPRLGVKVIHITFIDLVNA